jgi:Ca2+-binding RTX toxin-like protein
MCIICSAQNAQSGLLASAVNAKGHSASGQGTVGTAAASVTANVNALISGLKWASTSLTYALPTQASQYTAYDPAYDENGAFQPVAAPLAATVAAVMAQYSAVSGLSISLTSNTTTATMLVGRTGRTDPAHAYLPGGPLPDGSSSTSGDIWFGLDTAFDEPTRGSYGWATALHEIGHALGLKHSHTYITGTGVYFDDVGIINQPVSADRDSLEFTVMSYRSYINQDLVAATYYTNEDFGYPQTLMMLDIAAVQQMYGADFATNSGNSVYTFSATTGQMFINGVGQGAPGANRIFLTIWDGGGIDTYDFSSYGTNQTIDLSPGSWSLLSLAQRASLGDGNMARANLFNALQYQGDVRSLIENASGGSGNDMITGNTADNVLNGNAGTDTLSGGAGTDTLSGGAAADRLTGGADNDVFLLASADLGNGITDVITDYTPGTDTIRFLGTRNALPSMSMALSGGDVQVSLGGGASLSLTGKAGSIIRIDFSNALDYWDMGTNASWTHYTDYLNGLSQITDQDIVNDNGTRAQRHIAQAGTQEYTDYFNTTSQLTDQELIFLSGSREQRHYDPGNANASWQQYTDFINNAAQLMDQEVIFDNGTREQRHYDPANANAGWKSYTDYVNATGQTWAQTIVADDNWQRQTTYTVAGNAAHGQTAVYNSVGTYVETLYF